MSQGKFDHSYYQLGDDYFSEQRPTPVAEPAWLAWNSGLAAELGWPDALGKTAEGLAAFAGNSVPDGAQPIATVYAGHQFGSYNPQLGDGRAILMGEWLKPNGGRVDIQLKGAGRTAFSRGGDGRSPVGPVVREYVISEAMHSLGVKTTRALAAVSTGEQVFRQGSEPGAVLTRVASSHLRIGTIQFFAMSRKGEGLSELVDYITHRHYGEAYERNLSESPEHPSAETLLIEVGQALAALVAHWQALGFIHGVLNTDNMLLCGETIDYGPCAFMDTFDSAKVFSSIDTQGRYAYQNQPGIVHWNYSVLAQCLLPLLNGDEAQQLATAQGAVAQFPQWFATAHNQHLCAKFGLDQIGEREQALIHGFYEVLGSDQLDLTLASRWLAEHANNSVDQTPLPELFSPSENLKRWTDNWLDYQNRESASPKANRHAMLQSNPAVIPRNHQVARAIAAAEASNTETLSALSERFLKPFEWQADDLNFAAAPEPEEVVARTFCGT